MDWQFWAGLLIRSGIVLLAGAALRRFARRATAAERYRIALFGFGLLAVLPLLVVLLPEISMGNWFGARDIVAVETGPALAANRAAGQGSGATTDWLLLAWAVGAAIGLGWLVAGRITICRLALRAARLHDAQRLELVRQLSTAMRLRRTPKILVFDRAIVPATFGVVFPKILLPFDCAQWSDARWRAVFLHELAHIQRRDMAAQLFAGVICALWWFQPLAWRAQRSLREESERACDGQAMAAGMSASEYAAELLAIAKLARRGVPSCAIGMASGRLEARLHAILSPPAVARPRVRVFTAILALVVFGTAASAIDLGGSPMKRTILSGLLVSASLSAATIGGTVLDPSGAAIPNAKIVLINPDNSARQQTVSSADGKFSFDSLAAGQYIVRVEKPGFTDLFGEYTVKADTTVARALIMNVGRVEQTLAVEAKGKPAATAQPNSRPIRVGGNVEAPKLISKVIPAYPESARKAGVQGTVIIDAVILKNGTPSSLSVISSPSPALSQSALDAVRQWRYRPTLLNGQPVEVATDIRVGYSLDSH